MSLRERIRSKSAGLVKRETVSLPESGETVCVRGMMAGEAHRVGETKGFKQTALVMALCVEDPETGKPLWNGNVLEDVQEIEAMHPLDVAFLVNKATELSGGGKMKAQLAAQSHASNSETSSDSPSPEPSAAPFTN